MKLSEGQAKALDDCMAWWKTDTAIRSQIFRIFGYAGTGKTTIAKEIAKRVGGVVLYGAFTGKAALVMRKNGCVGASTLHSMIYKTVENDDGSVDFVWNPQSILAEARLLIIDECSMVDAELAKDVLAFGVPILVLGDPGQLPPISGKGFFTEAKPDVMLYEIHRQAKDNPIIHLATMVRNGEMPDYGSYGESLVTAKGRKSEMNSFDQVIVGKHTTRMTTNAIIRQLRGYEGKLPVVGERINCLKNNRNLNIYNGGMFQVNEVRMKGPHDKYRTYRVSNLDQPEEEGKFVRVHNSFFTGEDKPDWRLLRGTQEFDFGYAITCHRAQGSQWESVYVVDESHIFRDSETRWLYTAITRAQEKVTIYT